MFGQIKMEIPGYINWHTLISRKRDGKPRIIGGQFVVVRVGVHQLSVSPNTSHPRLQICSNLLHSNSMPSLNSLYIQLTPTQSLNSAQRLSCPAGTWTRLEIEISLEYHLQSVTIGIKHTIEKLDSWPKPVELQRFMSTLSEYSPISGRLLHT